MSEVPGDPSRSRFPSFSARLTGEANHGWFRLDLWLLDSAVGVWLAYALAVFRGSAGPASVRFALVFGLMSGIGWCLAGGHGRGRGWLLRIGGGTALAAMLALAASWISMRTIGALSGPASSWLAGAAILGGLLLRLVLGRLYPRPGWPACAESLRWLILLVTCFWLARPFYTPRPIGAGDAYWYDMMLSDFVSQVRAGQFPVWAGVTEYAFNGAVSPLRLAPWFQHFGAILDVLTAHTLSFLSLKNLLITVNMGLTGFSCYFFLRAILPRQPLLACVATVTCLASPAVLTPLLGGDQYMTFVALPFLPAVCFGLWRVAATNDAAGHLALSAGVSGLWLAHPPIAFWTTGLASLAYAVKLMAFRGPRVLTYTAMGAATFMILGLLPLVSVLLLENTLYVDIPGGSASIEIAKSFPGIFLPLSKALGVPSDNQPGYALLYLMAWSAWWFPRRRNPGAVLLSLGVVGLFMLFVPVPLVTDWFWQKMPSFVMAITNSWPMQRLVPIWAFSLIFMFAALHQRERASQGWAGRIFLLGWLALLTWSGSQAELLIQRSFGGIPQDGQSNLLYDRHNLVLSRYPFTSFSSVPSYFSHGHMNPLLEHRLLRKNRSPLASNIESAARKGALPLADPEGRDLLAHGTFQAVNDNGSTYYNLTPGLKLPPDEPLVLWLDALEPLNTGYLQILGQDVFREYMLPDSGQVSNRRYASRAFGTVPSSPGIISLHTRRPGGETPRITVILPKRRVDEGFPFARFELWRYDPARLPVVVKSWLPYHLVVNSPEDAYLETPRLWLGGYRAQVDGHPVAVERSPDNLAMFPVPAGTSDVTIKFVPPLLLEIVYWLCLAGWTVLLPATLFWLGRRNPVVNAPAEAAG